MTGPESEAVAALAAARADLRTSLESLARETARALRELAAGRDPEPCLTQSAVGVDLLAARVRERVRAVEAVREALASRGGGGARKAAET